MKIGEVSYGETMTESVMSRFIFGTGSDDKQNYVVHTASPFFLAKISSMQVATDNLMIKINGNYFYDFAFFESPPSTEDELEELVKDAAIAYEKTQAFKRKH